VIWRASLPSASAIQISSFEGRTRFCLSKAWYSSVSAPARGREARQTILEQSGLKNAPPS